ncbi:discoidin domain-containing protein [Microbulbifer sp. CnH-101-G]|uniref:discoidin domain-containing protein n=1 Tax=Microbulbifer sp. CnH-101-G TaxID=3243393 RepID=UPI00403A320A
MTAQAIITASSEIQPIANDGNTNTRWESAHGLDRVNLIYDLGTRQAISSVTIDWETANTTA